MKIYTCASAGMLLLPIEIQPVRTSRLTTHILCLSQAGKKKAK
uniref:Protein DETOXIFICATION Multidrug and toxic compound extrusion protein n=1 Tax=Rhizophora mucronata TaxID=61149 RepID=A0A2P2MV11_RHIMU